MEKPSADLAHGICPIASPYASLPPEVFLSSSVTLPPSFSSLLLRETLRRHLPRSLHRSTRSLNLAFHYEAVPVCASPLRPPTSLQTSSLLCEKITPLQTIVRRFQAYHKHAVTRLWRIVVVQSLVRRYISVRFSEKKRYYIDIMQRFFRSRSLRFRFIFIIKQVKRMQGVEVRVRA